MEDILDRIRLSDRFKIDGIKDMEVRQDIIDTVSDVPFIFNLIRDDRKTIHNALKDKKGKVIVDITEPHILENMDYFRQAAIHFKEHGCYTKFVKNVHPRSRYMQHWREEQRRCIEGLVRPDGEWISGYYYFYLNYCPILLVETDVEARKLEAVSEELEEFILSDDPENLVAADRIDDFPKVWDSDYLWFHYVDQAEKAGKHATCIKTRGRGYSFKGGSKLARNFFHLKKSKSYAIASEQSYLLGDALLDKAWDNLNFIDTFTPWTKTRDYANRAIHKKASYMDPKTKVEKGIKSEIIGVTTKGQPERARGKRGKLLLFEEAGKFPHLIIAHTIARPSVESGRFTFGTIVSWGTGGTEGADFDGLKELFTNPEGHRILGIPNKFDRNAPKDAKCGFYCGEYMNREGLYDENGNSDVITALSEIFYSRRTIIRSTGDHNILVQEKAERSITPDEAMMRKEGHMFNVDDLKHHYAEMMTNPKRYSDSTWKVNLFIKDGEINYRNSEEPPVHQYPIKENRNLKGCIEIYEQPISTNPERGLYLAGTDPYDDDISQGPSLGCTFIMNRLTKRIVAEYTGRPNTAEEFYENTYRLMRYYNAVCNYENNKKGMFAYFDKIRALHMLADTPKILRDMQILKGATSGNTSKGTNATQGVNIWRNSIIRSYLLDNAYGKEGERNWSTIPSIGLTAELIAFRTDMGNYDRVAALGMLLILDADMAKMEMSDEQFHNGKNLVQMDPFFLRTRSSFGNRAEALTNEGFKIRRPIRR